MTELEKKSSRRAFFLRGGAVLGAGVATTVGASALAADNSMSTEEQLQALRRQLSSAEDREAIRQLHLTFTTLVENQAYERVADLFDEQAELQLSGVTAVGKPAIQQLFADQYRHQTAATIHSAYRPNASQQKDVVTLSENGTQATATYHVDVQLSTPLQDDCTVAQMARLQGQMADCRWETGRLEAKYVKTRGEWKIASLTYLPA